MDGEAVCSGPLMEANTHISIPQSKRNVFICVSEVCGCVCALCDLLNAQIHILRTFLGREDSLSGSYNFKVLFDG